MKISGIVCEYNPFHNGHVHHIQKTRENGASHIVAVMSGNFVQRGDVALIDKFERAKIAVKSGADIVIEIPVAYSLSSAEVYARAAVYLLNSLGCVDEISFGSECGDINLLCGAAHATILAAKNAKMKELMESGTPYPAALQKVVREQYGDAAANILDGSNNLLAIEYIKALAFLNSKIKPFTIARKSALHDSEEFLGNIASASFIRKCIDDDSIYSDFIPEETMKAIVSAESQNRIASMSQLERVILYKLRTMSATELEQVPDIGHGLENRILDAKGAASLKELFFEIKTKRYPMARIRRIIMCAILGITKADIVQPPAYGRILAINERGRDILSSAKGKTTIPFSTSLAKIGETNAVCQRGVELEAKSTDVYNLSVPSVLGAGTDYTAKITIT